MNSANRSNAEPVNNAVRRQPSSFLPEIPKKSFPIVKGETSPSIRPNGSFPVFVGEMFDGIDIVCGKCNKQVLASNVFETQLRGISVACPACGAHNKTPDLSLDEPINPSRTIVLSESNTSVGHTVALDRYTAWIGIDDAETYAKGTGYRGNWRVLRRQPMTDNIDPVTRLRRDRLPPNQDIDLSGLNSLDALIKKVSQGFPLSVQSRMSEILKGDTLRHSEGEHPLFVSVAKLSEKAKQSNASISTDDPWLTVLLHSFYVFQHWRFHPRYERLCGRLDEPEVFAHNTSELAIATLLQEFGNGVTLTPENANGRRCDLWISGGPMDKMSLEVKSRNELRTLRPGLKPESAVKAIRAAFDSAGISRGGQLDPSDPGILGLGGFALSPADMETLVQQARLQIKELGEQSNHVAAVFAVSVGFSLAGAGETLTPNQGINLSVLHGVAPNPKYEGSILLRPLVLEPVISPLMMSGLFGKV